MDELDTAIARLLRAALDEADVRREDFAREMSRLGFRWSGNTVTQVVTGRRALSLLEVAGACQVLQRSLGDLLGHRTFELPSGFVNADDLIAALTTGVSEWQSQMDLYEQLFPAEHDEASAKVARSLGVPPSVVIGAAVELWGHSLTQERDQRVPAEVGENKRTLQSRRGHATRALIEELRGHLAAKESGQ